MFLCAWLALQMGGKRWARGEPPGKHAACQRPCTHQCFHPPTATLTHNTTQRNTMHRSHTAAHRKSWPLRIAQRLPSFGSAPTMGSPSAKKPCAEGWEQSKMFAADYLSAAALVQAEAATPCTIRGSGLFMRHLEQQCVLTGFALPKNAAARAHLLAGGDEVVGVHRPQVVGHLAIPAVHLARGEARVIVSMERRARQLRKTATQACSMRRLSSPWQAKHSGAAACNVAVPFTASGPQYLQPAQKNSSTRRDNNVCHPVHLNQTNATQSRSHAVWHHTCTCLNS